MTMNRYNLRDYAEKFGRQDLLDDVSEADIDATEVTVYPDGTAAFTDGGVRVALPAPPAPLGSGGRVAIKGSRRRGTVRRIENDMALVEVDGLREGEPLTWYFLDLLTEAPKGTP